MYKDLFLGIRQYDCNLTQDTFKRLVDIAYNSQFDNEYPGYQTSFFDLDDISLDLLKNTFIECCRDYYKITRKDIISLQSKHGITKPAWLMKNTAYRVGRASYTLPTLGQVADSKSDSE